MKLKRAELAAIGVTLVFLAFTIGFFLGRSSTGDQISVETQISAESSDLIVTAEPTVTVRAGKININTAPADELTLLKGIGDVLAQRIVDYRNTYGYFQTIEDIMNVKGIGEGIFSENRDQIAVEKEVAE